ncbi:MAG: hypothetical protein KDD15_33670, partial [Lewinella sp.]|nr:hypothetical protein [Lewinella sp.]
MILRFTILLLAGMVMLFTSCDAPNDNSSHLEQPVYEDVPFLQEYSVKYYSQDGNTTLKQVGADRNGVIRILSSAGLLQPRDGRFLYPGDLVKDGTYRTSAHKQIAGMTVIDDQLVYLDDEAVFSHAWAGKLFIKHQLPKAFLFAGSADFTFLVSDGSEMKLLQDDQIAWSGTYPDGQLLDIQYDPKTNLFYLLSAGTISSFSPAEQKMNTVFQAEDLTAFTIADQGANLIVGTGNGYYVLDAGSGKPDGPIQNRLPATQITDIAEIDGNIWFGSTMGAFMLREDGKYNYYFGERWLPGERVVDIRPGEDNSVLILTDGGLGVIEFKELTLYDKALYYEDQVRKRHIRLGFNAGLNAMEKGDLATGYLDDSDNDGLWTSMYLAGEAFRYAVTGEEDALQNCRESLDAMERLYTINPVPGFPSRSFERRGY